MFPWYVTQLPRLLRSFNHLEQKFLNVLLRFFLCIFVACFHEFSGNLFVFLFFCFSGWQVFLRRSKLCHFIIVLWLDSILLFVAKYIYLSAHSVTPSVW